MLTKTYKRDPVSKILINNDEKEYKEYKLKVEIFKEINDLKIEIQHLKAEIEILKSKESVNV
jgi:hypothetical protein